MTEMSYRKIWSDGVWHNNAGLIQLLGLCPLLAVSNTVINGLGLGLATLMTLTACNLVVSLSRSLLRPEIRIPAYVLIIASVVTMIELTMQAYYYELYQTLGIFIPLIVTNCAIIGRAEAFASRNRPALALVDGLATGVGFLAVLVVLGAMREILGQGTLLDGAELLFGQAGQHMTITLLPGYEGFLLALLPPGAFISLGLLVAARNAIANRPKAVVQPGVTPEHASS